MNEYQPGGVSSLLHVSAIDEPDNSVAKKVRVKTKKLARLLKSKDYVAVAIPNSNVPEDVSPQNDSHSPDVPNCSIAKEDTPGKSHDNSKTAEGPRKIVSRKRKPANDPCTIFVGNVSTKVDRKRVAQVFRKYGKVENVRFRSVMRKDITLPKKASVITKGFHEKCQAINAYVVFSNAESAQAALASNGEILEGLHLRVDSVTKEQKHDSKRSIFIGNMPFDAFDEEVRKHFEDVGDIEYVRLVKDPKTRVGKGFGYVQFTNADAVGLALRLHGQPLRGRPLRVQRCVKKEKVKPALSAVQAAQRRVSKKKGAAPPADLEKKKKKKARGNERQQRPSQHVGGKQARSEGKRAARAGKKQRSKHGQPKMHGRKQRFSKGKSK